MTPAAPEPTVGWLAQQLQQWRDDSNRREFDSLGNQIKSINTRLNDWFDIQRQQRENDIEYRRQEYERQSERMRQLEQRDTDRQREIDNQRSEIRQFTDEQNRAFDALELRIEQQLIERDNRHEQEMTAIRELIKDLQLQQRNLTWKVAILIGSLTAAGSVAAQFLIK